MACTIDNTIGGASANSYATVTTANAYFDAHPYSSTWDAATADQKCRALVTATRLIDASYEWLGIVANLTQRLMWPRRGVLKVGISYGQVASASNPWHEPWGVLYDSDEIPQQVIDATIEMANQLLVSDRTADSSTEAQGIRSLSAGSVSLTFSEAVTAKPIPDYVATLLAGLGTPRGAGGEGGSVTLYRA